MRKERVLFICKQRNSSWSSDYYGGSVGLPTKCSGLYNSVRFIVDALNAKKVVEAKIVDVVDNNSIDREVSTFRPELVIIEGFWVVPSKFAELKKLYPHVTWMVRSHSNTEFAAVEGMIFEWIRGYLEQGIKLAFNSEDAADDAYNWALSFNPRLVGKNSVIYLPNIYSIPPEKKHITCLPSNGVLKIGCFGAIRPFKNHLVQALASIEVADSLEKKMEFHINGARLEMHGNPVLSNLRAVFKDHPRHKLISHNWYNHDDFLNVVATMDLGTQVSFSETFNIVTADFVSQHVPVVVSPEIKWVNQMFAADPNDVGSVVTTMKRALSLSKVGVHKLNRRFLNNYSDKSTAIWQRTLITLLSE
jgi:hypothetical protein